MSNHGREDNVLNQLIDEAREQAAPELDWDRMERRLMQRVDSEERAAGASQRWRWVGSLAAAAVIALGIGAVVRHQPSEPAARSTVTSPEARSRVVTAARVDGSSLAVGDEVRAGAGRSWVHHAGQADWTLSSGGRAVVAENGAVITVKLLSGSVRCRPRHEVPRRARHRRRARRGQRGCRRSGPCVRSRPSGVALAARGLGALRSRRTPGRREARGAHCQRAERARARQPGTGAAIGCGRWRARQGSRRAVAGHDVVLRVQHGGRRKRARPGRDHDVARRVAKRVRRCGHVRPTAPALGAELRRRQRQETPALAESARRQRVAVAAAGLLSLRYSRLSTMARSSVRIQRML
jgi:hypothetical protein